ncbi:MAG: ATP-dependent Clp protease proteolytic subunit [Clostridia bacterium]|nr:ATP-dependent Clp protease proteolytic subunit [Clostridia bacterium]
MEFRRFDVYADDVNGCDNGCDNNYNNNGKENVSGGKCGEGEKKENGENGDKDEKGDKKPKNGVEAENRDASDGAVCISNGHESVYCMCIIGQIEGHYILGDNQKTTKYEHLIPRLVSVEEDEDTDGVLLVLNTMGGDVEAGLAIAEMVASMSKPTVSLVLGGGHSIGVPLAVAARRSFIVPSATMTVHPVRISGTVVGAPQTFTYFRDMQERIIDFICRNSRAEADTVRELMMRPDQIATDVGSVLAGEEAVKYGIIDEVGGLKEALASLRDMVAQNKDKNNGR